MERLDPPGDVSHRKFSPSAAFVSLALLVLLLAFVFG